MPESNYLNQGGMPPDYLTPSGRTRGVYLPAAICALISVGLVRTGFLSAFFVLPLGIAAFCYSRQTAWYAGLFALVGNGLVALVIALSASLSIRDLGGDAVFFFLMILLFIWIIAPPRRGPGFFRIRTSYRLVAGSVLAAAAFLPLIHHASMNTGFSALLRDQAKMLADLYASSTGADVVERSLSERYITPDVILDLFRRVSIRGGALVSCMVFFFLNRQIALLVAWFVRRIRYGGAIIRFHTEPRLIWVLSLSLVGILLGLVLGITPLEIIGWNITVICCMLYLVQGGGILLYFLSRPGIPAMLRIFINLMVFFVILSPGINAVSLVGLILLGIAENWVPFRVPRSNGSSPTPGM